MVAPVPLRTLYRMLCYAWDRVGDARLDSLDAEAFDRIEDLFGALLARATRDILRRGLARGYLEVDEERRAPKGRIEISTTMKRQLRSRGRVACRFDDLSHDIVPNRMLRSALHRLAGLVSKEGVAHDLRLLELRLEGARLMPFAPATLRAMVLTTGLRHYRDALHLCELIFRWVVPTDDGSGRYRFIDPRRSDQEMGRLFESFVRALLARAPDGLLVVRDRKLDWALVPGSPSAASVLPAMFTDIRVIARGELILVETKFTKDPLPVGRDGKRRLPSSHLYQLHAYVTHMCDARPPLGRAVLLSGTVGQRFSHSFTMGGVEWIARAVDLAGSWDALCDDVLEVVSRLAASPTGARSTVHSSPIS